MLLIIFLDNRLCHIFLQDIVLVTIKRIQFNLDAPFIFICARIKTDIYVCNKSKLSKTIFILAKAKQI